LLSEQNSTQAENEEYIFKIKETLKFLQVKIKIINNGEQILVTASNISWIKEKEQSQSAMRSNFFS
jgi:hypothetical protein